MGDWYADTVLTVRGPSGPEFTQAAETSPSVLRKVVGDAPCEDQAIAVWVLVTLGPAYQ